MKAVKAERYPARRPMSDDAHDPNVPEITTALTPSAQSPQTRVEMSATGLNSSYANFFRFNGTYEELLVDFGVFTGLLTTTGPEPIKLTQRIILSFPTAKRLLAGLQLAIAKHEQQFGPIEVDPQKRARKA